MVTDEKKAVITRGSSLHPTPDYNKPSRMGIKHRTRNWDIILLTLSNDFPFLTQFTKAWSPVCHPTKHDAETAFCDGSTLSYYKSVKNSNSDYFFNKQQMRRDEIKQFWQMSSLIILIKQEQGTSVTLELLRCLIKKKFDRQQFCCLVFMFYISKSLNLAFNAVLLTFYGEQRE